MVESVEIKQAIVTLVFFKAIVENSKFLIRWLIFWKMVLRWLIASWMFYKFRNCNKSNSRLSDLVGCLDTSHLSASDRPIWWVAVTIVATVIVLKIEAFWTSINIFINNYNSIVIRFFTGVFNYVNHLRWWCRLWSLKIKNRKVKNILRSVDIFSLWGIVMGWAQATLVQEKIPVSGLHRQLLQSSL